MPANHPLGLDVVSRGHGKPHRPERESCVMVTKIAPAARYYSVLEAAELLGITRVSVWRWVRDGKISGAERVGRALLLPRRVIDALAADRGTAPTPAR